MTKPHIGFAGIGIMGAPMADNLARAGYGLTLYDINPEGIAKLQSAHPDLVQAADSPKELALASDVVITMLPSGPYVQKLVLGEGGLIEGLKRGALLIDTSSSEPWLTVQTAEALGEVGVDMVDAPVSGAQPGALAAELVFMVGGAKEPVERARPIFDVLGNQMFHLGPIGAGHTMKCINNLITAMTFMATTEGFVLAKQFGLDPNVMTDVLNVSTGGSWISQTQFKQRIINRKFDDAFKLDLMVKDIGIAMQLANDLGSPLPLCALGQHLWRASARYAGKDSSISKLVSWVEHMTGVEIRED